MALLAQDRLLFWSQLRALAGLKVSDTAKDALEHEVDTRLDALRSEYEAKIAQLKASYPQAVARRIAEGLLKANGDTTVKDLLGIAQTANVTVPEFVPSVDLAPNGNGAATGTSPSSPAAQAKPAAAPAPAAQPAPAAAPAVAVAVNPTGEPLAPATVARAA